MNYWKKGCTYLLKNDPVFKRYYNPNHQLKTNKNNQRTTKSIVNSVLLGYGPEKAKKILISIAISSKNVKPKELVRLNNLCSQNITFTENLYSSLEMPHFTCTQCMINKKSLESYNF